MLQRLCLSLAQKTNKTTRLSLYPCTFHDFVGNKWANGVAPKVPSMKLSQFKRNLKTILLKVQNLFDNIEWYPENTAIETVNKVAL